jgi:hypothetical protein
MNKINWSKNHILKISNETECLDDISEDDIKKYRDKIEPWLTAVFQSEHLALLAGTGLTSAVASLAKVDAPGMDRIGFIEFGEQIKKSADSQAKEMKRGEANIEDDLRVAIELYKGLLIQGDDVKAKTLKDDIDANLIVFIKKVLNAEKEFLEKEGKEFLEKEGNALTCLKSFLISFASRTASRDRLNIVTTNYDRFIEYACDMAGILVLDSFTGKITPVFRTNKLELDYHYNPPGIRGEPRYVEGVIKYTKLHGSLDWRFEYNKILKVPLPFGADDKHPEIPEEPFDHVVIYPNSAKDIETIYFPYAELFREFSTAVCRPNSVIVTYGYGFGDSHVNRILADMLTIPSTHLVVIAWDNWDEKAKTFGAGRSRIEKFVEDNNYSQFTLLIGSHFSDLRILVDNYLPKAAIDRITKRKQDILKNRGQENSSQSGQSEE